MSNKLALSFVLKFHGDGTDDDLAIPLLTAQWFAVPPISGAAPLLAGIGNPVSAHDLSCATLGSVTITGATITLGILTVSFSGDVPDGDHVLQGTFRY